MNLGFYEETLTADNQKRGEVLYKLFKISSIIFFIIFAVMVIFTFAIPDFRTAAFIIGAICLIAGILLFIKKDSCIICYDYTFVDGSVRTAKILNNIKRKNGIEFDCSDITKIERTASLNKEYKISILLNIHHVDLALKYCDRVIGIRAGEIVFDGPASTITQEQIDEVYNGAKAPTMGEGEGELPKAARAEG